MRSIIFVLFCCLPGVGWPASEGAIEKGIMLAESRDFRAAVAILTVAIDDPVIQGDSLVRGLVARGKSHLALLGEEQAAADFRRALEIDEASVEANYQLGMLHGSGKGTWIDRQLQEEMLERAAGSGHLAAQRELARFLVTGKTKELKKSHQWLMKSARAGDPASQILLASRYERGAGLIKSATEAFRWYLSAAELGEPRAQYKVGLAYARGVGIEPDEEQARTWLRESARLGYRDARFRVGRMYAEGDAVDADAGQAAAWFWRAADMGHRQAALTLGESYLFANGVTSDFKNALYWFERAGNDPQGHYYRGLCLEKGLGTEVNMAGAFNLYKRAAEKGITSAAVKVAMMYMSGTGVEKDTNLAANYIRFLSGVSSAEALNGAAWMLVTDDNERLRNGKLGATLIRQAIKTDGSNSRFLDTRAAAHAELGEFNKAIRTQKKALKNLDDEQFRQELEEHLAAFEARRAWREEYVEGKAPGEGPPVAGAEIAFTGTIVVVREARGKLDRGLLLNRKPTHLIEIAVQNVTRGVLPYGQSEHLVIYISDPAAYFTEIDEVEGVQDYPLQLLRFSLKEVATGGWHHDLEMTTASASST